MEHCIHTLVFTLFCELYVHGIIFSQFDVQFLGYHILNNFKPSESDYNSLSLCIDVLTQLCITNLCSFLDKIIIKLVA